MMKRLTLRALASFIGLSAVILATYSYALPRSGGGEDLAGPFLVTLELTRLGQRSFEITVPTVRQGEGDEGDEDDFAKMVDNDNGRAFGFWPEVRQDYVEVTVRELRYDAMGDKWLAPDLTSEPLEVIQVRNVGPSFTRLVEEPNNYKIRLVGIRPLDVSAGSAE